MGKKGISEIEAAMEKGLKRASSCLFSHLLSSCLDSIVIIIRNHTCLLQKLADLPWIAHLADLKTRILQPQLFHVNQTLHPLILWLSFCWSSTYLWDHLRSHDTGQVTEINILENFLYTLISESGLCFFAGKQKHKNCGERISQILYSVLLAHFRNTLYFLEWRVKVQKYYQQNVICLLSLRNRIFCMVVTGHKGYDRL